MKTLSKMLGTVAAFVGTTTIGALMGTYVASIVNGVTADIFVSGLILTFVVTVVAIIVIITDIDPMIGIFATAGGGSIVTAFACTLAGLSVSQAVLAGGAALITILLFLLILGFIGND